MFSVELTDCIPLKVIREQTFLWAKRKSQVISMQPKSDFSLLIFLNFVDNCRLNDVILKLNRLEDFDGFVYALLIIFSFLHQT